MNLDEIVDAVHLWSAGALEAKGYAALEAMTADDDAAMIAELAVAADACPIEGMLSYESEFWHGGTGDGCSRLERLGYVIGRRKAVAAVPVLRGLFATHPSREARLVAGHLLLHFEGTAGDVAAEAVTRPLELVGWFRLWVAARIAMGSDAYDAVTARLATAEHADSLVDAAMDAVWSSGVTDARWGDLAMQLLEREPGHYQTLEVMARLRDRRAIPFSLEQVRSLVDIGGGFKQLAQIVDGDELFALLAPVYAKSPAKSTIDDLYAELGIPAGMALVEKRRAKRARPKTKRAPKPRAPKAPLSFPFLFFGADANDWFEHSDLYLYIVCFDGILDAAARLAVGTEVSVQPHIHFNDRPWMWGDLDGNTWAFAYTVPAVGCGDAFQDIHAAVPIRELIFGDLREEARDRWTAWSRKQKTASQRVPHLDPTIKTDMIYFYARREIVVVSGVVDTAFERERQRP